MHTKLYRCMSHSEKRKRTVSLAVRLMPSEVNVIKDKARDTGLSVSGFFRACALGRRTRSTIDSQVINELRRLGGLQKHLFNQSGGSHSKEFAAILVEIKNTVKRIAIDAS